MPETVVSNSADQVLIDKIKSIESQVKRCCDFIPIVHWGFDESVQEKLRQRKHRLVNQNLSKKEKQMMTNEKKQRFARTIGGVHTTVSEVLDWMSTSIVQNTDPKKAEVKKLELKQTKTKNNLKTEKPPKKVITPAKELESEDSSDEEEEQNKNMQKPTPLKKIEKPVAAVKPTPRKENTEENEEKEDGSVEMLDKSMEHDSDSTDEETEQKSKKGNQTKRKPTASLGEVPAKKSKIDKELEKFENVDISTLDPIESRKVAMLKLQKKIETMKISRKGSKGASVTNMEEERKMKRRMSKLKGKQKRAEEKKGKEVKAESIPEAKSPKEENLPRTEEGNVVYSKFDFIVKDDKKKKKRMSTSEKRDKFSGKDYKSLLTKVEKREEKIAKLRETEPERAKEMEQDIKWNRALKKAEGIKVKDNAELLKKGLKRKEKLKEKKLTKWSNREERVNNEQNTKQEKRNTNLQKRIDDKKKRKLQSLRKKGRIL